LDLYRNNLAEMEAFMKIIVLDGYTENPGDLSWDGLRALGELTVYDRTLSAADAIARIRDAEIVFTNKTPVTAEVIRACPRMRYIGVLATGYNVVDLSAAARAGITVTNIPSYGTESVAQFTIALLLELCHHIGAHSDSVRRGDWERCPDFCYWNYPMMELNGKTMGIIGFGRIGQRVAQIARAFGMNILANATHPDPSLEDAHCHYADRNRLLAESDVVSLHCPLNDSTRELINRRTIAQMKDGALLINSSRGGLINESDLRGALDSGKLGGAAADVVSAEPIRSDNPLLNARNMILTPHIAWAPREARQRLMDLAVSNLEAYLAGKPVNVVS
jgi:glycerate dehydrogenase